LPRMFLNFDFQPSEARAHAATETKEWINHNCPDMTMKDNWHRILLTLIFWTMFVMPCSTNINDILQNSRTLQSSEQF
jgi:hypothetical protein